MSDASCFWHFFTLFSPIKNVCLYYIVGICGRYLLHWRVIAVTFQGLNVQKCGLRSAYQPFYHHKWSSAVQNSLECNSHASFQESFKVNKCMSVPIENFDFLSKLLTNSGVQCKIPSPHHSNILSSLHEQELLMHSYDYVSFLFYLFLL